MKTVDEILANWDEESLNYWYAVDEITTDGRQLRLLVADGDTAKEFAAIRVTGAHLVDILGEPCEPGEYGDEPFFRCQLVSSDEALEHFRKCAEQIVEK